MLMQNPILPRTGAGPGPDLLKSHGKMVLVATVTSMLPHFWPPHKIYRASLRVLHELERNVTFCSHTNSEFYATFYRFGYLLKEFKMSV